MSIGRQGGWCLCPRETGPPLQLASFSVEGWCGHGLGASIGGRRSRHCLESAGEGMGLGARRESYTIRAVQMPKVQDRVRVRSQVDF